MALIAFDTIFILIMLCYKHGHRWNDNIRLDLREIGLEGVGWIICLRIGTSGKLMNMLMNLWVP
jgi:hypothetical protein